ncbi:MAG: S9 family peptidase [Gammaproteobacteria bacterium]|nr:S9 family peptidase [Gammaproteobacteria bacterium]
MTSRFGRSSAVLLLAAMLTAQAWAAGAGVPRRLTADDFYLMQSVSDPQLAPDGQWVAYLLTTHDREADEARSAVWMVSWDGAQHVPLTAPSAGISAPRWSPDGRYLSYLSKPGDSDHNQIMLLDRRGGEARALTRVNDDIGSYEWSPDSRRIVLSMEASGDEPAGGKAEGEADKRAGAAGKRPRPIVIDAMHFKEDIVGYLGSGHEARLYLLDVASGAVSALTNAAGSNDTMPVWSPEGERIAFVRTSEKDWNPDGTMAIALIDARPGAPARELARPYAPNTQRLAWSPDGTLVAFMQGLEPKYYGYMQDQLVVVPAGGGAPRVLSAQLDRAVMSYEFAADGKSIVLLVEDDGSTYPARLDLGSGGMTRLVARPITVAALTAAGGHVAMVASDDASAAEVYALEGSRERRLTTHGEALLGKVQLGAAEDFRFKSRDGTEVHGMLVKPPGYVAGKKYPAILWIHGGPNGQDDHSADFDSYQFRRQLLAAGGYVVLGVNYRGSSGRGFAYGKAIWADWGHLEVEDLLAGVDALVARGLADPQRLGIGGWSYGGILTDYTIASDGRFKAACSGAGSANQISMYGVDQYILQYNSEIGPPWRNQALWLKLSYPFFHADRIHTPTLFMGGDRDFNVPIAGGEQMYQALRTLGVPTQLVVYPDQFHELTRPSFMKDRLERQAAWFAQYLHPEK